MTDRYQNQYRIPSARAPWHSYSADGVYFITICTSGRETLLGEVVDGAVVLSAIGNMVREEWEKSFEIRKELTCDAYVIMPNHIHAILRIDHPVETHGRASLDDNGRASLDEKCGASENNDRVTHVNNGDAMQNKDITVEMHGNVETHGHASEIDQHGEKETHGRASLQINDDGFQQGDPKHGVAYRLPKSISSFVAGFKSAATKRVNEYRNAPRVPLWQERFHDHIIRNDQEYQRILEYIQNNPTNWDKDKFYNL